MVKQTMAYAKQNKQFKQKQKTIENKTKLQSIVQK